MCNNLKSWIFTVKLLNLVLDNVLGTTCFKNEEFGNREGNVYYCETSSRPECCEKNEDFTCCEENSSKALREQLILWGAIIAVVILIAIIICWLFKDYKCCSSELSLRERCGCKKKKSVEDDEKNDDISANKKTNNAYRVPKTADGRPLPSDEDLKISPSSRCTNRHFSFYY